MSASLLKQLQTVLSQLDVPLKFRVEQSNYPTVTQHGHTWGDANSDGTGIVSHPGGNMQLGGDTAHISLIPQYAVTAVTGETQHNGSFKLFPDGQHQVFDINTGSINSTLIPPKDPLSALRFAPPSALVTVTDANMAPTDTPQVSLLKDPPIGLPGPEGIPTTIYVVIPDHTHADVAGVPGPVTSWHIGNSCAVPVHGVTYQYLFGHNRCADLLTNNMNSLYTKLLKDLA